VEDYHVYQRENARAYKDVQTTQVKEAPYSNKKDAVAGEKENRRVAREVRRDHIDYRAENR